MLMGLTIFLPKVVVQDLRYVSARACWSVASETWLATAARIGEGATQWDASGG